MLLRFQKLSDPFPTNFWLRREVNLLQQAIQQKIYVFNRQKPRDYQMKTIDDIQICPYSLDSFWLTVKIESQVYQYWVVYDKDNQGFLYCETYFFEEIPKTRIAIANLFHMAKTNKNVI